MAPTHDTGWIDTATGEQCADPFTCPGHGHPEANAGVELLGPNMAAINLTARLRGVTFAEQWTDSLREWRNALTRQITIHATEAAVWVDPETGHVLDDDRTTAARMAEAHHHLERIRDLIARRTIADHMLADSTHQHYN